MKREGDPALPDHSDHPEPPIPTGGSKFARQVACMVLHAGTDPKLAHYINIATETALPKCATCNVHLARGVKYASACRKCNSVLWCGVKDVCLAERPPPKHDELRCDGCNDTLVCGSRRCAESSYTHQTFSGPCYICHGLRCSKCVSTCPYCCKPSCFSHWDKCDRCSILVCGCGVHLCKYKKNKKNNEEALV